MGNIETADLAACGHPARPGSRLQAVDSRCAGCEQNATPAEVESAKAVHAVNRPIRSQHSPAGILVLRGSDRDAVLEIKVAKRQLKLYPISRLLVRAKPVTGGLSCDGSPRPHPSWRELLGVSPSPYFTRRKVVIGTEPSCRAATRQESSSSFSS